MTSETVFLVGHLIPGLALLLVALLFERAAHRFIRSYCAVDTESAALKATSSAWQSPAANLKTRDTPRLLSKPTARCYGIAILVLTLVGVCYEIVDTVMEHRNRDQTVESEPTRDLTKAHVAMYLFAGLPRAVVLFMESKSMLGANAWTYGFAIADFTSAVELYGRRDSDLPDAVEFHRIIMLNFLLLTAVLVCASTASRPTTFIHLVIMGNSLLAIQGIWWMFAGIFGLTAVANSWNPEHNEEEVWTLYGGLITGFTILRLFVYAWQKKGLEAVSYKVDRSITTV